MSKLIDPVHASLDTHREGYLLLKEILALPHCPWKHRLLPYGAEQSAIVTEAIHKLTKLLDHTYDILGVNVIIDRQGILNIFSLVSRQVATKFPKSVSEFIYSEYVGKSIFLEYYKKEFCEDRVIKKLLIKHQLYDQTAIKYAFDLKNWFLSHKEALRQLNPGSWDIFGLNDWETFLDLYLSTATKRSTIPVVAMKPNSIGMYLVDKALQAQDIRLLFKEEEYAFAESALYASAAEIHNDNYPDTCPIESIGDFEAEMAWRLENDNLAKERVKKNG